MGGGAGIAGRSRQRPGTATFKIRGAPEKYTFQCRQERAMTLILLLAPMLLFIAVRILAHRRRMSGTLLPAAAGNVAAALPTLLLFVTLSYVSRGIQDPQVGWANIIEADGRGRAGMR